MEENVGLPIEIRDNDWRKGEKRFIGTGTLVYSFGLMNLSL